MKDALHKLGIILFGAGIVGGIAWFIFMFGYFAINIVPLFFERGDYMPLAIMSIIVAVIGGGILAGVTEPRK